MIVIVGGGLQGCMLAYYLKIDHGLESVIVEQESIGCAASGKAGGFLAREWSNSQTRELHQLGFDEHQRLAKDFNIKSYRRIKCHQITSSNQQGRKKKKNNNNTSNISSLPWLSEDVGIDLMDDESTSAQVNPSELCLRVFEASGAKLIIGKVCGIILNEENNRAVGVKISHSADKEESILSCTSLALTIGPWSCNITFIANNLKDNIRNNYIFPINGIRSTSMILKPKDDKAVQILQQKQFYSTTSVLFCEMMIGEQECHLEIYPRNDGSIYFCGLGGSKTFTTNELSFNGEQDAASKVQADKQRIEVVLTKMLPAIFKHDILDQFSLSTEQACLRPITPDALPIIGKLNISAHINNNNNNNELEKSNVFISAGHNCWGILWSPSSSKALAELMVKNTSTLINLKYFDPARFL